MSREFYIFLEREIVNPISKLLSAAALLTFSTFAQAQYYKTLPKGVRSLDLRNIKTTTISSSYNHSESEAAYSYDIELDSETLKSIDNDIIETIYEILSPYPDAANAINLGKYHLDARANMEVDVFGFGYGVTNKLTAYFGIPFHTARVKMNYSRPKGNNYDQVAQILQNYTSDDIAQGIGKNIETYGQNLDIDGAFLQNLVVNHFNYEELGDWEGSGPGDTEFGLMYNFLTTDKYGLLLSVGGNAPTGRVDDPDILQDVGFGDGQWDAFVEFGGSYLATSSFYVNSWFRYTYQFAADKDKRVPYSADVFIGDETATFNEKLGNRLLYHFSTDYVVNDWITLNTAYEYDYIGEARYRALDGRNAYAESILASNTEAVQHNFRTSIILSSVGSFQKGNFLLPASLRFTYQQMMEGRNTAKYDRYELQYRMFF